MRKTSFYFGTFSGVAMIMCFMIPYFLYGNDFNYTKAEIAGYVSLGLCQLGVFFGIRSFRDKKSNGYLSFGTAFGLGSEISGIAGLIFAVYSFLLFKYFSPELSARLIEYYRNRINNSGSSHELIVQQLQQLDKQAAFYSNPLAMAVVILFTVFVIGLVISLISAFILKRKEKAA